MHPVRLLTAAAAFAALAPAQLPPVP
ncbi:MAG: hypothetical protein RL398_632, partial [Planctomycetota bacterium]